MPRWLIAGLAVVVVHLAVAQERATTSADATRHLTGAVLDADTGQPIEGARLQLFGVSRVPVADGSKVGTVLTGKDGVFDTVIPVDARPMVQASAEGYIAENSRAFLQCSPCDVTLRLHAKAVFTGRAVAADNGEPIVHVQVEAFPFVSGGLAKRPVAHVFTNSGGEFSLEQLAAGQYFLRFTPTDAVASLNLGNIEDPQSRQFLTAWWPGGTDWQQASPATAAAGSPIRLPDIRLSPDARFSVSGTLLPQYCLSDESFRVTILRNTNGSSNMLRSIVVSCGAEYSFSDLTPGSYAIAMDRSAGHEPARVDVQVRGENLRADLPVIVHPAASGLP